MRAFQVLFLLLFSASAWAQLSTVPYVDLNKYVGTWYQIARNPIFFENGCVCSRQVLTPLASGQVQVYNSCNLMSPDGPLRDISGLATNQDPVTNAKFKVDFNLPKKGDYWVIGLDAQYRYAVVSEPSMAALYILSKTPTLDAVLYQEALQKASDQVDISKLSITPQSGCVYP